MPISTDSDIPDRVSWQNPTGVHGGSEVGSPLCKGLSPEYGQMLAHKVIGENPVTYSELLLAAWKLERWAEARDPLLPKTPTTGSSNIT